MRKVLVFSSLLCSAFALRAQNASSPSAVKDITPEELAVLMKKEAVLVLDCNEADNYAYSHVPGAKLVVYDHLTPEELPSDTATALVFYCYSPECPAAATAAHTASTMGHTQVYCMTAGITGWEDAHLPTEP